MKLFPNARQRHAGAGLLAATALLGSACEYLPDMTPVLPNDSSWTVVDPDGPGGDSVTYVVGPPAFEGAFGLDEAPTGSPQDYTEIGAGSARFVNADQADPTTLPELRTHQADGIKLEHVAEFGWATSCRRSSPAPSPTSSWTSTPTEQDRNLRSRWSPTSTSTVWAQSRRQPPVGGSSGGRSLVTACGRSDPVARTPRWCWRTCRPMRRSRGSASASASRQTPVSPTPTPSASSPRRATTVRTSIASRGPSNPARRSPRSERARWARSAAPCRPAHRS